MIQYKVLKEGCDPRGAQGDAGLDLRVAESVFIYPQETVKIPTGVAFVIPNNMSFIQITARSSTALQGCHIHIGTIDHTFNGREVHLIATNMSDHPIIFKAFERVAQAVGLDHIDIRRTRKDIDTTDSKKGFGSTGRS